VLRKSTTSSILWEKQDNRKKKRENKKLKGMAKPNKQQKGRSWS
jgi:hypothetical protein